jgi:hypothetical protein
VPGKVRIDYAPELLAQELAVSEETLVAALGEISSTRTPEAARLFVERLRNLHADARARQATGGS